MKLTWIVFLRAAKRRMKAIADNEHISKVWPITVVQRALIRLAVVVY